MIIIIIIPVTDIEEGPFPRILEANTVVAISLKGEQADTLGKV